ncbi:peptidyl-prolyl cis-trans isomerase [Streptomyces sp. S.PB5]|uniref:peptidyl-prolyl cis-trans isomerase n=1 Tax=Streptomyces sp. S.PB5 TaxID=3020844 RepID=UPI0025B00B1A|nr:peptidyl-prolyl cis-trans isomerase [Streptomyces sp. S.PB5]MDN3021610.1 peptidyl-prolyl cis-trans isomerase [Streptomyces sp. S.PB5]
MSDHEHHAATVNGTVVSRDRVNALLEAVPARDHEARPEAFARAERQRRRWATQVVVVDELARQACARRGLSGPGLNPGTAPPRGATSHDGAAPDEQRTVTASPAELGSIVAVALAHSPAARTLLEQLEREQLIPEEALYDYYDRNRDRFLTPEALSRGADPFSETSDLLPYDQVREGIAGELRRAAGHRAFFDWLDQARADVVYAPGHEHPGDPSHPDHEHRH